jgi:nucleoside-diphosphate-sugar epimerase
VKALVTGAGGFVGAHLAIRLARAGHDVYGTLRAGSVPARIERLTSGEACASRLELCPVDLSSCVDVSSFAARVDPDVVFMLGAARDKATAPARSRTAAVNASSAQWLIDGVGERCRAVVRLGSSTEYAASNRPITEVAGGQPRGFFGATKAAGSLLTIAAAAERDIRAVVLRAFQVYGPLDHPGRLVPALLGAARTGDVLPLTETGRRRDWVYVDDVVEACLLAADASDLPPGQVLNIGTGIETTNEDVAALVEKVSDRPVRVDVGAHPGRSWDASTWVCDPTRARMLLGWEAKVPLADGLRRCWEFGE